MVLTAAWGVLAGVAFARPDRAPSLPRAEQTAGTLTLALRDGRRIEVTEVHRVGDKVRFTVAATGEKRQVDAQDVIAPPLDSIPRQAAAPPSSSAAAADEIAGPVDLRLKDGRRLSATHVHRVGDKVRFQVAGTGEKRQVAAADVVVPAAEAIPVRGAAPPAATESVAMAQGTPPEIEMLREPVELQLKDGRRLSVVGLHQVDGRVRFQVAGTSEKRQVPVADVASPVAERIPVELRLTDGRVLRVVGLFRQDGRVRFQVAPGGQRRQIAESQVAAPGLDAIPQIGVATAGPTAPTEPVPPAPPAVPTAPEPARPPLAPAAAAFDVMPSRWDILDELPPDRRLQRHRGLDPYNQNRLKGDKPIAGDSVFLVLTGSLDALTEGRRLPLPSGVSAVDAGQYEFFGRGEQLFTTPRAELSLELFKGQTAFRPKAWALKATVVGNLNYLKTRENNAVDIDPRQGPTRRRQDLALQEAFGEVKLKDLSPRYDVVSLRAGIQPFTSDFRGFVYRDTNLGARLFGNASTNRWQYNLALFEQLEKDTNSDLNTLARRHQQVLVANLFRQDAFRHGYQVSLSYHLNRDRASDEPYYDANDFLVRPARIGSPSLHDITTHYLGLSGDGHLGRLNISHAAYFVFGRDEQNPLGRRLAGDQTVRAGMAALELSVDRDWARFKLTGFFASGDGDAEDGKANGFDSIEDDPNFAGGPFSFWVRSGIPLTQTAVLLKAPNSLLPDLRTSKFEGQANHVNPGLLLAGASVDLELTPRLRAVLNANWLQFHRTGAMELLLFQPGLRRAIGLDLGGGFLWRPLLNENVVVAAGVTALRPAGGFQDLFSSSCTVAGCGASARTLGNAFAQVRLTY